MLETRTPLNCCVREHAVSRNFQSLKLVGSLQVSRVLVCPLVAELDTGPLHTSLIHMLYEEMSSWAVNSEKRYKQIVNVANMLALLKAEATCHF